MFPAVVVDLGTQVGTAQAAWVLAACNAAIVRGTCELEAPAGVPPRAVAIVRLQGGRQRVRIEVGLRESERAAWSVREIEFSRADPERERWRTVGLVLATLVGEVEAARAEAGAADASSSAGAGAASEAAPPPAAAAPAEAAGATPARRAAAPEPAQAGAEPAQERAASEQEEQPEPEPPLPEPLEPAPVTAVVVGERDRSTPEAPPFPRHHGVFVGLGVLASPATAGGDTPWGGALRGGYSLPSGWVLALHADYRRARFDDGGYTVDSLRVTPSVGYRLSPDEHWSIGLSAAAGVRALWARSGRAGAVQQNAWSPLIAGSLELWWQALPVGGVWAALELATIGRATRVLGSSANPDAVVPAADARGLIGFWAAL